MEDETNLDETEEMWNDLLKFIKEDLNLMELKKKPDIKTTKYGESSNIHYEDKSKDKEEQNISTEKRITCEEERQSQDLPHFELQNLYDQLSLTNFKLRGRNGYEWKKMPINKSNIYSKMNKLSTIKEVKQIASSPIKSWSLLFTDEIIDRIVEYTNEEIQQKSAFLNEPYEETTALEIKTLIGIFYIRGVTKCNKLKSKELWSKHFGVIYFRASLSHERFTFLVECLRFNDKTTRNGKENTLTAIQGIWDIFIHNCQQYYSPSQNCIIDEQILGFHGKCPFRVRMKNKPDKVGLKVVMMNDAKTGYMLNAIPYTNVNPKHFESTPDFFVTTLSQPIHGSGRNIITDNWFTSKSLVQTMLKKYSLTMIGKIKKKERVIPSFFTQTHPEGVSLFAFDESDMLVSYVPRQGKIVLVLSSLDQDHSLNDDKKPTVIDKYNTARKGLHFFNSLCHHYTVAANTTYWPLRLFYAMLDQAYVNSFILYTLNHLSNELSIHTLSQKLFLYDVANSLLTPFFTEQIRNSCLKRSLRNCIAEVINTEVPQEKKTDTLQSDQPCTYCLRENNHTLTTLACISCGDPICDLHRHFICIQCV